MPFDSVFEIVELSSGEVILRKVEDDDGSIPKGDQHDEPLILIRFSEGAREALSDPGVLAEVGRSMISEGIQQIGRALEEEEQEAASMNMIH